MRRLRRPGRSSPAQPPPCPAGWHVGPPDFVGVGVQRAGTSWWFDEIASHPEVHQPSDRPKELHFFDDFSDRVLADVDVARYHAWFARPPGVIAGEWTPSYAFDPWSVPLLARAAPRARVLLLLRDPVARFASGLLFQLRRGHSHPDAVRDAFHRGLYAAQVARLQDHVAPADLLVLSYEEVRAAPAATLARTAEFVGLDPGRLPARPDAARPHERSARMERELPPELRAELTARYRDDLRTLTGLLPDLDLDRWPTAAAL